MPAKRHLAAAMILLAEPRVKLQELPHPLAVGAAAKNSAFAAGKVANQRLQSFACWEIAGGGAPLEDFVMGADGTATISADVNQCFHGFVELKSRESLGASQSCPSWNTSTTFSRFRSPFSNFSTQSFFNDDTPNACERTRVEEAEEDMDGAVGNAADGDGVLPAAALAFGLSHHLFYYWRSHPLSCCIILKNLGGGNEVGAGKAYQNAGMGRDVAAAGVDDDISPITFLEEPIPYIPSRFRHYAITGETRRSSAGAPASIQAQKREKREPTRGTK
ncbi:hypothetical protein M5K25_008875 [Dendrobium thyrsiflorum]|uniref:Uncharacterized protein n=1 Tax=Dendrobium thyrsiflorum TaxID=117978 RepID=A0ABD0VA03_DENTH